MQIIDLYNNCLSYWKQSNLDLFGVGLYDIEDSISSINEQLSKEDFSKGKLYNWLKEKLDKDYDKKTSDYKLRLNEESFCIDVYAEYGKKEYVTCSFPLPTTNLTWVMNNAQYTPRVIATRSNRIRKYEDKIIGPFRYENNKFYRGQKEIAREEAFDYLTNQDKILLNYYLKAEPTMDNFTSVDLPEYSNDSVFNYDYRHIDYYEDLILKSYQYAKPKTGYVLGINRLIISQSAKFNKRNERISSALVRTETLIESLEAFRTVVNVFEGSYKPAFAYTDADIVFDAFKTVTSGEAGRQRLLLDNVTCKDNLLYIDDKHFFESAKPTTSLSCLSMAPFCDNDKAKRIMMNAKMTAQAVPLKEELDPITHRIYARVGFMDLEGYSFADSIIISESFAKRLETTGNATVKIERKRILRTIKTCLEHDYDVPFHILVQLIDKPVHILKTFENVKVKSIEDNRVKLTWTIPFHVGDKITNLHGAKGTVGLILPDEQMPRLLNKVGNMEDGPLEVIVSGFSTVRRGSLGQIFEAWATASDIDDVQYAADAIEKYKDQMEDYSSKSIVQYKDETAIKPVGICMFMRLHHDAVTHLSLAGTGSKGLRLGEMERLNLLALNKKSILKELSLRSPGRHIGNVEDHSERLQETRQLFDAPLDLSFNELIKTLGYTIEK